MIGKNDCAPPYLLHSTPKWQISLQGRGKRELPGGLQTRVPPVKNSPWRQMWPVIPTTNNFAGSCILPSKQEEGQPMRVLCVLKAAFKQDGRTAISEDPLNQKLPHISAHHPRAVPKRNGFAQVFKTELTNQGSPAEVPWSQSDHIMSPRSHCLPLLLVNP